MSIALAFGYKWSVKLDKWNIFNMLELVWFPLFLVGDLEMEKKVL